jgi:hypothetical protein
MALHEDGAMLRVQPRCQVERRHLARLLAQGVRVLRQGDGVHVHDAEVVLLVLLLVDPAPQRAQVVAQVQNAGWLHTGEDALLSHSLANLPLIDARSKRGRRPRCSAGKSRATGCQRIAAGGACRTLRTPPPGPARPAHLAGTVRPGRIR